MRKDGVFTRVLTSMLAGCALLVSMVPAWAQQDDDSDTKLIDRVKGYMDKQIDDDDDAEPEGFYPRIGGLTTGSGFALGGGFRTHLSGTRFYTDLSAVVSTKKYIGLDGRLRLPSPIERLELWTNLAYRHYPQEDYFGLGASSSRENRTSYGIDSLDIAAEVTYRIIPALRVGTRFGYWMPEVEPGSDANYPSIEERFADITAPGLAVQPDFFHYGVFTSFDTRDVRGNPRRGGFYEASFGRFGDRRFDGYDFRRLDIELRHYVSVGSPRHVVVGRGGASYVNNKTGERVPFYVFPYVGGASTVRSYEEFRFRDENAVFFSGEYRFGLHEYVQLVAFVDAGKVTNDWDTINFSDLKTGYGGGIRAGTASRTFVRLEFGTGGGEGTRVFLKFMPSF